MSKIGIGVSIQRKEAWSKVTGAAVYCADQIAAGTLSARLVTSKYAHSRLISVDTSAAEAFPGVIAVVKGDASQPVCGTIISDQPPFAISKVRYYGEPVAAVVAIDDHTAAAASKLVETTYEPLPPVLSVREAVAAGAPLVHEDLGKYELSERDVYPEPGTNIAGRVKIRKGDQTGDVWRMCTCIAEGSYTLPKSDHAAMETRAAVAEITPDGDVFITASSQSPFEVQKEISRLYNINEGRVNVKTPLVGGGFGGKAPVELEILAYICSAAAGGRRVRLINTREDDMAASPSRIGLEADIKLGATADGTIAAAQMTFYVDAGGYSDITPRIAKAIAADCSGPYKFANITCDSLAIYTNHGYSTSFRGFGHAEYVFCLERTIDKLARLLGMDPAEVRMRNAICPGSTNPTQTVICANTAGNLGECIERVKNLIEWDRGIVERIGPTAVRAKGMSCLWKTSTSPTDAISGAILTFNTEGGINLNIGAVEIGPSTKTTAAQILAEKFKMDINNIFVAMDVDTRYNPKHWKTVASMSTYMLGRSILRAADDAMRRIKSIAAVAIKCDPDDLEIADQKVYLRAGPDVFVSFKEIVHGFKYPDGLAMGGQIMGCGSFVMNRLTMLDKETGKGKSGPAWTVGAQAVEIELDLREYTYKVLRAATVLDVGLLINPKTARGLVTGAVCMGLGIAGMEQFKYEAGGKPWNTALRTYKVMHYGEQPQYLVDFVETPQPDAPYGARGLAEHGIIGIPAALGNAISAAVGKEVTSLPITPEAVWRLATGGDAT